MEVRGREACEQLNRYGGVQEICKKIYTSPTEGKIIRLSILNYSFHHYHFNLYLTFINKFSLKDYEECGLNLLHRRWRFDE